MGGSRLVASQSQAHLLYTVKSRLRVRCWDEKSSLRCQGVAPWVSSHMHTLRILGNETVHARTTDESCYPSHLGQNELMTALSAIRALIEFWEELDQRVNVVRS